MWCLTGREEQCRLSANSGHLPDRDVLRALRSEPDCSWARAFLFFRYPDFPQTIAQLSPLRRATCAQNEACTLVRAFFFASGIRGEMRDDGDVSWIIPLPLTLSKTGRCYVEFRVRPTAERAAWPRDASYWNRLAREFSRNTCPLLTEAPTPTVLH